ncbi:MAG: NAD(P)H-binding protein, partial [Candidatus Dormibacterales bacterium]
AGPGGPRLRALVREAGRAALPEGVEVVEADLLRPQTLAPAMAGMEVVVHAAAVTADRPERPPGLYDLVNRGGTGHLVAAAREAGVRRLVVMSGLGTQPAPPGTYMATRWGMEEAARASDIPHVILRPSVLFGRGAPFTAALARLARRTPVLPLPGAGVGFQPLWVEDLVTCLVQSLTREEVLGRALPLGGAERLTFAQVAGAVCAAMGLRRPVVPVPLPLARLQARLMAAALPNPPLTPAALELFSFENSTRLDAVESTFGFRPRGLSAHLREHGLEG